MYGSHLLFESSIVRATQPGASALQFGMGIEVSNGATGQVSTLAMKGSVLEENHMLGLVVWGSDATVQNSVIRGTQSQVSDGQFGNGVAASVDSDHGRRSNVVVDSSMISGNHAVGVFVFGSDVLLDGTVVRDTEPNASGAFGRGAEVMGSMPEGDPAHLTIRSSLVSGNHDTGLWTLGAILSAEGMDVRDTMPSDVDEFSGVGVEAYFDSDSALRPSLSFRSCVIESNHWIGLAAHAADAVLEGTVVRGTLPAVGDQSAGVGLQIDVDDDGHRSAAFLSGCAVDGNHAAGIFVEGSDAVIEGPW